jgi:hypothetical protein
MAVDRKHVHTIEIPSRPPSTWAQTVHAILYFIVFNFGCVMINASQFVFLLPLHFLPLDSAKSLYGTGIRLSKGAFGTLLSKSLGPSLPGSSPFTNVYQSSCVNGSHLRISS